MSSDIPALPLKVRQAILELTNQADDLGLAHSLIRGLNTLVPFHGVSFYLGKRFKPPKSATPPSPLDDQWLVTDPLDPQKIHHPIEEVPGLAEAFVTKQMVLLQDAGSPYVWVVHPILNGDYVAFLTLKCLSREYTRGAREMVEFFLTLFGNQAVIIHKKERDPLTGLLNRQSFDEKISKVLYAYHGNHNRHTDEDGNPRSACLAVMDIDHFKRVNDTFGHLMGDEVLLMFAQIMDQTFRHTDSLFRFGGEEFVVLLSEVSAQESMRALDRMRRSVEQYHFPQVGGITVSIGAVMIGPGEMPSTLIDKADKALYFAKNNGRNQVWSYHQLVAEGKLSESDYSADDIEVWN